MLRLHHSKKKGFVRYTSLLDNYEIGTNFKVFAFAGSYLINRHAAEFFLKRLIPMSEPFDLAIFAGWEEVKEMSVFPQVFLCSPMSEVSSIGKNRKIVSPLHYEWWTALLYKLQARKLKYAIQKKRIEQLENNRR